MNTVEKSRYKLNPMTLSLIFFILSPILSQAQHSSSLSDIILPYIILLFFSILNNVKFKIESTQIFAMMLWISVVLSTVIRSAQFNRSIISYLFFVLFFILITAQKWNKDSLELTFKIYVFAAVICSLAIIGGVIFEVPYSWGRYSIDILGIHKNPNYVASFIAGAYSIVLYSLLHYKNKKIFKNRNLTLFLVSMIIGTIFTGTRAAFLTIVLCTLIQFMPFIFNKHNYKNKMKFLIVFLVLMIIMFFVFNEHNEYIPTSTIERILNIDTYSDSSRLVAWEIVYDKFLEYPILGLGLGKANQYLQNFNSIDYLHNVLLELLINQGITGFLFFSFLIFSKLRYIKDEDKILIFSIGITLFFPILFQNGLIGTAFWWPIIILIILINFSRFNDRGLKAIFDQ